MSDRIHNSKNPTCRLAGRAETIGEYLEVPSRGIKSVSDTSRGIYQTRTNGVVGATSILWTTLPNIDTLRGLTIRSGSFAGRKFVQGLGPWALPITTPNGLPARCVRGVLYEGYITPGRSCQAGLYTSMTGVAEIARGRRPGKGAEAAD